MSHKREIKLTTGRIIDADVRFACMTTHGIGSDDNGHQVDQHGEDQLNDNNIARDKVI